MGLSFERIDINRPLYGTLNRDLNLHLFVTGTNTRDTTLFNYFSQSWDSYNNFTDFEPVFPPDPEDLPDEVKDVCGGRNTL